MIRKSKIDKNLNENSIFVIISVIIAIILIICLIHWISNISLKESFLNNEQNIIEEQYGK